MKVYLFEQNSKLQESLEDKQKNFSSRNDRGCQKEIRELEWPSKAAMRNNDVSNALQMLRNQRENTKCDSMHR